MTETKFNAKYLLQRLKAEGLPHSRPSFSDYIKSGIIPEGFRPKPHLKSQRFYTSEEIETAVTRVRERQELLSSMRERVRLIKKLHSGNLTAAMEYLDTFTDEFK